MLESLEVACRSGRIWEERTRDRLRRTPPLDAEVSERRTTGLSGGRSTLQQLRRSGLTHATEDGASTPILMARPGHTSVRSLAQYDRISAEALGSEQAERDPAGRKTGSRR